MLAWLFRAASRESCTFTKGSSSTSQMVCIRSVCTAGRICCSASASTGRCGGAWSKPWHRWMHCVPSLRQPTMQLPMALSAAPALWSLSRLNRAPLRCASEVLRFTLLVKGVQKWCLLKVSEPSCEMHCCQVEGSHAAPYVVPGCLSANSAYCQFHAEKSGIEDRCLAYWGC